MESLFDRVLRVDDILCAILAFLAGLYEFRVDFSRGESKQNLPADEHFLTDGNCCQVRCP